MAMPTWLPSSERTAVPCDLVRKESRRYWLVLANATIWAAWAVLSEQYAAGVSALINGPAVTRIGGSIGPRCESTAWKLGRLDGSEAEALTAVITAANGPSGGPGP